MKRTMLLIVGLVLLLLLINCTKNPVSADNKRFAITDSVTDIDGNRYHAITIGTQTWTVENLKTTKYNDGTALSLAADSDERCNPTAPGFCWYENDSVANKSTYGALYNWYAVNTGKLAPTGWHVPSDSEWLIMQNYLIANGYNYDGTTTGNKIGKSLADKSIWASYYYWGTIGNDISKNNSSGFSALPGSYRDNSGIFYGIGYYAYWWTATGCSSTGAFACSLGYLDEDLFNGDNCKSCCMSIRLVKD